MRAISRARWDALAAYCRKPLARAFSQELAWFEAGDERILATLIIDTDDEFSGIILARDGLERFRSVGVTGYFDTPEQALADLNRRIMELLPNLDEQRIQGDESGRVVDFFAPLVAKTKLHPDFRRIATDGEFSAARRIISAMMRWHEDIDGNFVEQFQTTGFDARVWELYLFAALTEANLEVLHPKPAPDFLARGLRGEFAVEATTINPSRSGDGQSSAPRPQTEADLEAYNLHYLPIKYAGPLTKKLSKEYWKHPLVAGKPLVIAIQDFHSALSMTYSGSALPIYLYGLTQSTDRDEEGRLTVIASKISEHKWGNKVVPSGFFSLPKAENISAVIFNSGGTIAKFNRMGVSAGFGADDVVLIRRGTAWNPDPNSSTLESFVHIVHEGYPETWIQGMDVYHNPNAMHPLDPDLLPGAAHHRLLTDGRIETIATAWQPIKSLTSVLRFSPDIEEETVDDAVIN
ncbi:hypothetical protein [Microbispora sp. H11081]|uniref:hypothetical protein n=1 Tax=Microbispora sp. H11081 TaxID=2729107 RepID=UPI001476201D|nr:hypothetical protein [Microbispora sp. H11081]